VLCRADSCVIKQSETLQKIGLGGGHQGDQIGRISIRWAIVYGQCFEIYRSSPNFLVTFSTVKIMYICMEVDKKWVGIHLGDFFTNSSGHLGGHECQQKQMF
jgi:hypothetical protein